MYVVASGNTPCSVVVGSLVVLNSQCGAESLEHEGFSHRLVAFPRFNLLIYKTRVPPGQVAEGRSWEEGAWHTLGHAAAFSLLSLSK